MIHETQGIDTGPGYQKFFSCETDTSCRDFGICSDGERCNNALVDWLIDQQGRLWEYQDPYNTNRIPWASGGPENNGNPIGAAINGKYRGFFGGVNRVYAAVEMVKTDAGSLTPAQIFTAGKLLAYVMAKAGIRQTTGDFQMCWAATSLPRPITATSARRPAASPMQTRPRSSSGATRSWLRFPRESPLATSSLQLPSSPTSSRGSICRSPSGSLGSSRERTDGRTPTIRTALFRSSGPSEARPAGEWPKISEVWAYDDGRRYFLFADGSTIIDPPGDELPKWLMAEAA